MNVERWFNARKAYRCDYCQRTIMAGERYKRVHLGVPRNGSRDCSPLHLFCCQDCDKPSINVFCKE